MKESLISILRCPDCQQRLGLRNVSAVFWLGEVRHIVDGVLGCEGGHRFPTIDEVPRLVPTPLLEDAELAFLESESSQGTPRETEPVVVPQNEVLEEIRRRVRRTYNLSAQSSPSVKARVAAEIEYQQAELLGSNKRKYAKLLAGRISPDSILDVGGGLPGLTRCLYTQYEPSIAVVADLNVDYRRSFKTPGREIDIVRADAQALPFEPKSFSLVVSAFVLEHVPDWKSALRGMVSSGRTVFIAFGPNSWFPFEIGHLNAPLAGTLPKPLAAWAAYIWLGMIRQRRPMRRIREILVGMTYVSSRRFQKESEGLGVACRNLFPELVEQVSRDAEAPQTVPRKIVRALPGITTRMARVLSSLGVEPQMYFLLEELSGRERSRGL